MTQIDVSIVIPTYNRLWSLPRAVDSCRGTSCRTEIIVVDDGSEDGTWEWLEAQSDVTALHQENQGQTWAVNRGAARARGRYIRFLDSDDALAPGIIDKQLEAADSMNASLVYSRVDAYDLHNTRVIEKPELPLWDDFLAVQLGEGDQSHFLGMMFKRELIESVVPRRPEFALRDDRMFLLEVGLRNPKLALVPGCGGYWTKHSSQMHDRYTAIEDVVASWQMIGIYRRILGLLERRGDLTQRRRRAAAPRIWLEAHHIARVNLREASQIAAWVRRLDPSFVPGPGLLGRLYQTLGFTTVERILNIRRALVAPFRSSPPVRRRFPGDSSGDQVSNTPTTTPASSAPTVAHA
jgi:glycosyltransferase involved in cell wall biosynthesis